MNANRITGLAVMLVTAGLLTACGGPEQGTGGAGAGSDFRGPGGAGAGIDGTGITSSRIDGNPLDDGLVHVWPQNIADRVFFDTDKTSVKPEGQVVLGNWIGFLKSHPRDQLLIEGHSDERGTREYNLALGERRAQAIKEFLVAGGIQAERIKTVTYGKERPAVLGSNNEAYAQNRRGVGILQ